MLSTIDRAQYLIPHERLLTNRKKHKLLFYLNRLSIDNNSVLPSSKTLEHKITAIYDQQTIGSCTANALCQAYKMISNPSTFEPSRLYLYWNERAIEDSDNTPITDSGADAVDGLTFMLNHGICPEDDWSYDTTKVNIAPPTSCDSQAKSHTIKGIESLDVSENDPQYVSKLLKNIKTTINNGYPIQIGIEVYLSFMSKDAELSGVIPIPDPLTFEDPKDSKDPYKGGHEILLIGYDNSNSLFKFANSWGTSWGDKGFGYLPYSYVTNKRLTQEFRYFKLTTDTPPQIPLPPLHQTRRLLFRQNS